MSDPRVTVLLPVYNSEKFTPEAVQSILDQSFVDFELVIINDGSTDNTAKILAEFDDPRIRLINHDQNKGLIPTLNEGIQEARGEFIARMDADDISLPDRLQVQVEFMDSHPQIGILGGWAQVFGDRNHVRKVVQGSKEIHAWSLFSSPFIHPTVMIRASEFNSHGFNYDNSYPHMEDYELWTRVLRLVKGENLQRVLIKYRSHPSNIGTKYRDAQIQNSTKLRTKLLDELGVIYSQPEFDLHQRLSYLDFSDSFLEVEQWLVKLIDANRSTKIYEESALNVVLSDKLRKSIRLGDNGFLSRVSYIIRGSKLLTRRQLIRLAVT